MSIYSTVEIYNLKLCDDDGEQRVHLSRRMERWRFELVPIALVVGLEPSVRMLSYFIGTNRVPGFRSDLRHFGLGQLLNPTNVALAPHSYNADVHVL